MEQLAWIESSALSVWLREAWWGIPMFGTLTIHTIGMGLLVGIGAAIALRILGFAPGISLQLLPRLMPVMHVALFVTIVSGVLLLIAYPTKALTNPLLYVKLAFAVAALLLSRRLTHGLAKPAAVISLLLWGATLAAGKFLEYTYKVVLLPLS
jgi:hypothetical protein